jgi:hypothetical protein
MLGYLRKCLEAVSHGLQDGIQRTPGTYHGSTEQVALFNAASDALRIIVYGSNR